MKRTLTALVAAAVLSAPAVAGAGLIGIDLKPVTDRPPADEVRFVSSRVIKQIKYDGLSFNRDCPMENVPSITYSLVTQKGDTLSDVMRMFEEAGALLYEVPKEWQGYSKERIPEDYLFVYGHVGACSPGFPKTFQEYMQKNSF